MNFSELIHEIARGFDDINKQFTVSSKTQNLTDIPESTTMTTTSSTVNPKTAISPTTTATIAIRTENVTSPLTSVSTISSTSSLVNTSSSSNNNNNIKVSTDDGRLHTEAVIGAAAAGAVVFLIIIFIIIVVIRRRYRKNHLPPPLPKLDEYGLTREESTLRPRNRYDSWVTSDASEPHNDPLPSVDYLHADEGDRPSPDPVVVPDENSVVSDCNVYVNLDVNRPDSGTGIYIVCPSNRPESVPLSIAPGFDCKRRASPKKEGVMESMYMPMGLGSSTHKVQVEDDLEGIYTPPGGEESVYSNPDQLPPPCFPSGRPYVNVPKSHPQEQNAEQDQGTGDKGDYQNLSVTGHVYDNIPQDASVHNKKKIIRSESLKNMATPQKVSETLQGCQSSKKHPSKSDKNCGGEKTPPKTCTNLHKAQSTTQVPSSWSKLAPITAGKRLQHSLQDRNPQRSLPQLLQESDSDSEGGNYENLKGCKKDGANAADKKEKSNVKSNLSNGAAASNIPTLVSKKPGAVSKTPDTVNSKPAAVSSKPETAGTKPGAISNKPGAISSKPGTATNKPGTVSSKPGTVSNEPGSVSNKPGTDNAKLGIDSSKLKAISAKPGIAVKKPGIVDKNPGAVGTKPGTVSTKPGTVSTKPGTVSTKPGMVSTKPGTVNQDQTPTSKQKSEKAGNTNCSNELMQILAKRRQNDGHS